MHRDSSKLQGNYKGTNKLCLKCSKECKQFENVGIIRCGYKPAEIEVSGIGGLRPAETVLI